MQSVVSVPSLHPPAKQGLDWCKSLSHAHLAHVLIEARLLRGISATLSLRDEARKVRGAVTLQNNPCKKRTHLSVRLGVWFEERLGKPMGLFSTLFLKPIGSTSVPVQPSLLLPLEFCKGTLPAYATRCSGATHQMMRH